MNLHVPLELEAKLARVAAATGRTIDQLALDVLAGSVTTMNGSAARSQEAANPLRQAGCSITTRSLLERIAADVFAASTRHPRSGSA